MRQIFQDTTFMYIIASLSFLKVGGKGKLPFRRRVSKR